MNSEFCYYCLHKKTHLYTAERLEIHLIQAVSAMDSALIGSMWMITANNAINNNILVAFIHTQLETTIT